MIYQFEKMSIKYLEQNYGYIYYQSKLTLAMDMNLQRNRMKRELHP